MTPAEAAGGRGGPVWPGAVAILALALAALAPALGADFVWDDDLHLLDNPVLLDEGLWRVWFRGEAVVYWPVTWTSYWLEHRLWGLDPTGYHVVNALLHGLNAVLLWRVLLHLRIPAAWLAACVFAVHPVNVESAAWVAQRKNLLCFLFAALAMLAFLRFERGGGWRAYGLALGAYGLSMLSKGATVGLPLVLLLSGWWRRARWTRADLLRVLPFLLIAFAVSLLELYFHRNEAVREAGLAERLITAGWAVWFYLYKALLPIGLSFVYPRWEVDPGSVIVYLPGLLVAAVLAVSWWLRDHGGRPWFYGAACFVLLLAPVLGLVDFYYLRYSLVGDHYAYFALVVPIAGALALAQRGAKRLPARLGWAAGLALVALLSALTWQRAGVFRDAEGLWRDTLRKVPEAALAHHNLGLLLIQRGETREGWKHLQRALSLTPRSAETQQSVASVLYQADDLEGAMRHAHRAIELDPDFARAHATLALVLEAQGRPEAALERYDQAIALNPADGPTHFNRARLLVSQGRLREAADAYRAAVAAMPDFEPARNDLALVLRALAASAPEAEAAPGR